MSSNKGVLFFLRYSAVLVSCARLFPRASFFSLPPHSPTAQRYYFFSRYANFLRFFLSPFNKVFASLTALSLLRKISLLDGVGLPLASPDMLYKERTPKTNLRGSQNGGYLLSHNAMQYHRRCCLSLLPSPLSAPLLSALSHVRAPQARTPPPTSPL